jgi:hypothetical protein
MISERNIAFGGMAIDEVKKYLEKTYRSTILTITTTTLTDLGLNLGHPSKKLAKSLSGSLYRCMDKQTFLQTVILLY